MPGFVPPKLTPRDLLDPRTVRALLSGQNAELLLETGFDLARRAVALPALADELLRRTDRGDLTIRTSPSPELERHIRRVENAGQRIAGAVLFAGLAVSGAILYAADAHTLGGGALVLAGLALLRVVFYDVGAG